MTITSEVNRIEYIGNGSTTDFSFPFYVLASGDLQVFVDGVLQAITTDYALTPEPPQTAGVNVAFLVVPPSLASIVILRDPPITQAVDLVENDSLPAEVVEETLDRLTMICQRLSGRVDRSFVLDDTVVGVDVTLPIPDANKLIGWNATADALAFPP